MEQSKSACWGEKEQMTDLLCSEKHLATTYLAMLLESATPEVVQLLTGILSDTQQMQHSLFEEMNSRGYYPVTKAEDGKVQQARQKLATMATV